MSTLRDEMRLPSCVRPSFVDHTRHSPTFYRPTIFHLLCRSSCVPPQKLPCSSLISSQKRKTCGRFNSFVLNSGSYDASSSFTSEIRYRPLSPTPQEPLCENDACFLFYILIFLAGNAFARCEDILLRFEVSGCRIAGMLVDACWAVQ